MAPLGSCVSCSRCFCGRRNKRPALQVFSPLVLPLISGSLCRHISPELEKLSSEETREDILALYKHLISVVEQILHSNRKQEEEAVRTEESAHDLVAAVFSEYLDCTANSLTAL